MDSSPQSPRTTDELSGNINDDVPVHLRKPPAQRKMQPYDFWRKIGSPKYVVAPMVDNSDLAFRMQTRKYGSTLTYTQMLNANSFVTSKDCRANLFQTCPEDRPLFAQLAGCDPAMILKAAKFVEDRCDAVDMNFGCPQGIAKRGRYGAFLMEELELLDDIVRTLVEGLSIPVTCKTRIYHDFDRTIRLCETLYNAGAYALTIHGRTREEKGHLICKADWDTLKKIKEHFSKKEIPIPIIANGGIETMDDVIRCLEYTGCDAVMTSEGILENPALFGRNLTSEGVYMNQLDLADEYLDYCEKYPVYHMKCVRSHILKMVYRYITVHEDLRNKCGYCNKLSDFRNFVQEIRQRLLEEEAAGEKQSVVESSEEPDATGGTSTKVDKYWISWYNRHRYDKTDDGEAQERKPITDPDHLLNLKESFVRGDDDQWDDGQCCGGGIFSALNMFGSQVEEEE